MAFSLDRLVVGAIDINNLARSAVKMLKRLRSSTPIVLRHHDPATRTTHQSQCIGFLTASTGNPEIARFIPCLSPQGLGRRNRLRSRFLRRDVGGMSGNVHNGLEFHIGHKEH